MPPSPSRTLTGRSAPRKGSASSAPEPRMRRKSRRLYSMRRASHSAMARLSHLRSGGADRVHNSGIRAAAADMPLEPIANPGRRRVWVLAEQRHRAEDHARCAEAALKCGVIEKRLLYGVKGLPRGESFDGDDLPASYRGGADDTGFRGAAVDQHGAGPALALAAAVLRPGDAVRSSQRLKECDAGGQIEPPVLAVYVQLNFHYARMAEARNTREALPPSVCYPLSPGTFRPLSHCPPRGFGVQGRPHPASFRVPAIRSRPARRHFRG